MSEQSTDWTPLVLAVAPNGARKTKADHAALPIEPDEIARTAAACREAGAAMIHLHVRDREGKHSLDVEAYRAAIAALHREIGDSLVIQVTSEAVGRYNAAEQMAMVRQLRPEAARFFAWLATERILPQFILYSDEDLRRFDGLIERGVVPDRPCFVLFVLGRYTKGQVSTPADLLPFLSANLRRHAWAVCAFGRRETACALAAAALGGHARVGFENNIYLPGGELAPDNAALIAAAAEGARNIGRPLADADAARSIMSA